MNNKIKRCKALTVAPTKAPGDRDVDAYTEGWLRGFAVAEALAIEARCASMAPVVPRLPTVTTAPHHR